MFQQGMFLIDPTNETPESIAKKRAAIQSLSRAYGRASNIGEGVGDLFHGIGSGLQSRRLNKTESAGREQGSKLFGSIMEGAFGRDPSPVASASPISSPSSNPIGDLIPNQTQGQIGTPTQSVGQPSDQPIEWSGTDLKSGIAATAQSLGIDPVDLATAISYETAGTFDPKKRGPTTQWGQHRGLIQFGEPQADRYGVNWDDPIGSQLGPDGAVAKYLRDTGVEPGMGLLDIYSAINAGGVGLYNRSDANNGGAPGTVRNKVEKQMAGHRKKAMSMFASPATPEPTQVASLDPQSGLDAINQYQVAQRESQQALVPVRSVRTQSFTPQSVQAQQPQPQVAQAQPQQAQQTANGLSERELIEAAQNPWLTDGQRQVVNTLLQQRMQARDPMRQLEMQRLQQELATGAPDYIAPADRARLGLDQQRFGLEQRQFEADQNKPMNVGGSLINPRTGEAVYSAPRDPMTVNPGQIVIDPNTGQPIFSAPAEQGYSVMSPEEVQSMGLPAGSYQRSPDGQIKPIGGGGTSLSVDTDGNIQFNQGGAVSAGRDTGTLGKELSKSDRAMLDTARDASTNAENLDSLATQLETVSGNVGYTGPGGDIYGKIDDAIGILPGDSGARGAFRSLAMEAQLTFTEKTKGAITDREMGMFRQAVPNLSQTPEGNQEIIKTIRAGAQRTKQRSAFFERFMAQNGSLQGAQSSWQRFITDNPLIGSGEDGRFQLMQPADPTPYLMPESATPSATPQQTEKAAPKRMRFDPATGKFQ